MRSILLILLVALLAACSPENGAAKTPASPSTTPKVDGGPAIAPPKPAAAARELGADEAEHALPGFPMEALTPFQRGELISAAEDEFVYSGAPTTLAGCVRGDLPCKQHALRGLTFLAAELGAGMTRTEALTAYGRYYGSFATDKRRKPELANVPCKGPEGAPITLVEYADFECGHCGATMPILEELLARRPDVRLCFKHFPLGGHQHSMSAAMAAEFARRSGKFWEVHHDLFVNQRRLSPDVIKEIVGKHGLDPKALIAAVGGDELAAAVEAQKKEAESFALPGTPAIFINGRLLEGGPSPALLEFTLQDELLWAKNGGKWVEP